MKCFSASLSLVVPLALTSLSVTTAEVLSEEPILKWYKDAHLAKGKSVFLEQMKKFVEWLKNAEEGKPNLMESNHNYVFSVGKQKHANLFFLISLSESESETEEGD